MKKMFSEPEVTVIKVEENNVICTSIFGCGSGKQELTVDSIG